MDNYDESFLNRAVVVAQWLWHSGCGTVVVAQWLWQSGCLKLRFTVQNKPSGSFAECQIPVSFSLLIHDS